MEKDEPISTKTQLGDSEPPVEDTTTQTTQDPNKKLTLKFLTYNIFLRPPMINNNGDDFKDLRYKLFVEKFLPEFDFINFQELFSNFNSRKGKMIKEAKSLGYKWTAKSPKPPFFSKFFIDSGLLTLSKYEIVVKKFLPFKYKSGIDGIAFKGCLYSKIKIRKN